MDASITYGFLLVLDDEAMGYTGGLLLVDQNGKPTEFHCTAPVVENRTQKILYGQTYQSHVYCDLISKALIEKCSQTPELLFVEQKELTNLAGEIAPPVLMVSPADGVPLDESVQHPEMQMDDLTLTVLSSDLGLIEFIKEACSRFTSSLSIDEPFERIRQAIGEAQQVARQNKAA